ncbi:MAG: cell division topological specificity factor MinE [Geitlerinemataceae cyanobacterium]
MHLIGRLFNRNREESSRETVKQRLQLTIAHDRAALSPATIESMQKEILAVVTRYVEIDTDKLNFALRSSDRMTSLTADLPIRRIRKTPLPEGAIELDDDSQPDEGEEILFDEEIDFSFDDDEPEADEPEVDGSEAGEPQEKSAGEGGEVAAESRKSDSAAAEGSDSDSSEGKA